MTIIQEQVSFLKLFTLTFHIRCNLFRLALGVTVCSLLLDVLVIFPVLYVIDLTAVVPARKQKISKLNY